MTFQAALALHIRFWECWKGKQITGFVVHPPAILSGPVLTIHDLLEPLRPIRAGNIPVAGPESTQPCAMQPWGIVAAGIHGWTPLDTS